MPPRRGELGYGAYMVQLIEAGRCGCEGCPGTLTDSSKSPAGWRFCRVCGCARKVGMIGGGRYAERIANYEHCKVAAAELAENAWRRERDARQRRLAEEEAGENWEAGR